MCVAYDRWRIGTSCQMAADDGIALPEMKPFGQGYGTPGPAVDAEQMLLNGQLAHADHPVMNMCVNNAICTADDAGKMESQTEKPDGRIDFGRCGRDNGSNDDGKNRNASHEPSSTDLNQ